MSMQNVIDQTVQTVKFLFYKGSSERIDRKDDLDTIYFKKIFVSICSKVTLFLLTLSYFLRDGKKV